MSSCSSTEREPVPGAEIAGFRLERRLELAAGGGVTWEATQLSLDRRVSVEFLPPGRDLTGRGGEVLTARPTPYGLMVVTPVRQAGGPSTRTARPRRRAYLSAGAAGVVVAVMAAVAAVSDDGRHRQSVPGLARGERSLGSDLRSGVIRTVDCVEQPPSGGSPACTIVQTSLTGRTLDVGRAGVVRRWLLRGARGQIALQVLHRTGRGFAWGTRTPYATIGGSGVTVLPGGLAVRPGDVLGLDLAPGAAVGVGHAPSAATARWLGPPSLVAPERPFRSGRDSGPRAEVMLRVDYAPGARPPAAGLIKGRAATRLDRGRTIASQDVEPLPGQVRTVSVVVTARGVAIDLLAGRTRLARLAVSGADAAGALLDLTAFGRPSVRLRYRNPGGAVVEHVYDVGLDSLAVVS